MKTAYSKNIIVVLVMLLSFDVLGAYFSSVKRLSVEDGLPATTIFSMLKDEAGYFWLGTPSGLVRYDGYEFEVYNRHDDENAELVISNAGNVFMDSQDRIWLGSWGRGAAVYDRDLNLIQHFRHNPEDETSIGSDKVQTFFEDAQGNVWLGTNGGGLAKYQEQTRNFLNFKHDQDRPESLSHNRIWSIAQTSDGIIWVATSNGLNKLVDSTSDKFIRYQHDSEVANGIDHPLVRALLVDGDKNLWVGTETSFGRFNSEREQYQIIQPQGSAINAAVTRIRKGLKSEIWVGTQKGLYRYETDKNRFTPLVSESKYALLPHDDVRDIYVAKDDAIWVATRYAGLTKVEFTPSAFIHYTEYTNIQGQKEAIRMIYALHEDHTGQIWVGSSNGIMTLEDHGIEEQAFAGLAPDTDVYTILEDNEHNLWIGGDFGVAMITPNRKRFIMRNELLMSDNNLGVVSILQGANDIIWIATDHGGLVKHSKTETIVFKHDPNDPDSISENDISGILEDDIGRLWVGTSGTGLNRLDPDRSKFFRYGSSNGIDKTSPSNINTISQTKDGTIWVGTASSLDRLDEVTDNFKNFSVKDGLVNSRIHGIVEDDFGDLWISTDFGVSQFKRDQNYFVNYTKEEGLHGNHFFVRSSLKTKIRGIMFGGNNGITQISSGPVKINLEPPRAEITGVWVDGKKLRRYNFSNGEPLELDHTVKNIQIKFSALDFNAPENNQFSYRIENFDETWAPPTKENKVNYSGLDSGVYNFQVKASNNNNIWGDEHTELQIIISTPWWQRAWVRTTIGIMIVLLAFAWYKRRTRLLAQQKQQLEKEVSLRTEDLFDAQKQLVESEKNAALSGLVAGVAHEINTPVGISVTAASNLMERSNKLLTAFQSKTVKRSEFEDHVKNIHESAEMVLSNLGRAAELIRSFKEVSVDQISQQRRKFDFKLYMQEIIMSLNPKLKKEHVAISLDCPEDMVVDSYPGAIAQLITNLAMNALLHAFDDGKGGHITITVKAPKRTDDKINITFCDDGKGIPKDQISKIFEPFYTTKRGKGGSGLGLQIITNIVNIRLGGSITCKSELGKGTCFNIEILSNPS